MALLDGVNLTPRRLLAEMLSQFGVPTASHQVEQLLQMLNRFVTRQTRDAHAPILFIDNAVGASTSALRLLDWLAALVARRDYALRIVLTGKENLSAHVENDSMRSLARHHPATYSLNPLTKQETMIYLRTRFIAAGGERSEKVFPVGVCERLHELSHGWPRLLNERAIEVMNRITRLESAGYKTNKRPFASSPAALERS